MSRGTFPLSLTSIAVIKSLFFTDLIAHVNLLLKFEMLRIDTKAIPTNVNNPFVLRYRSNETFIAGSVGAFHIRAVISVR